jgi:hypothetical protein
MNAHVIGAASERRSGADVASRRSDVAGRRLLRAVLLGWALLTAVASTVVYQSARIDAAPMPDADAQRWAIDALQAGRAGVPVPQAPASALGYRAQGPVIALLWFQGRVRGRYVGSGEFAASVQSAAASFAQDAELRGLSGWPVSASNPVRFTLTIVRGSAPLWRSVPLLANLALVPDREGALARLGDRTAYVGPDELMADELFEHVRTPIPDLTFGVDLQGVEQRLAAQLGVDREQLVREGRIERFLAGRIAADRYPAEVPVTRTELERGAREGAEFLLRHQEPDGRYTYLYRAHVGVGSDENYNLPRHAGTTYFLAHAARVLDMPAAREGALRALRWLMDTALTRCGSPDHLCIRNGDRANMGSAALTALAASELLRSRDDAEVRTWLVGLTAFIRSQQRPDGELMHEYDLVEDRPIDVQRMYFSGEAADALLASQRVLGDARNLDAARRLMRHLTGAGWNFFGSRYFYGEEHWTCQAAAQAALLADSSAGLDFCVRWLGFQRVLQYQRGQTPWPVEGAIGVGPLLVPRMTSMASRMEAAAMLYPALRKRGYPVATLRSQIEAGMGLILRMRWGPGPTHLMFDAARAAGGVPGSFMSLDVRNDFVQHACSALLHWVEALREEEAQTGLARADGRVKLASANPPSR